MLVLPDVWIWDSWYVDDGERFHAFYLKASRALIDHERRHMRPSVGHAVSDDLVTWVELADALVHEDAPAFDDQGIWTGSIVRDERGTFHLFYTGIERRTMSAIQRTGHAVSDDLLTWHRVSPEPVVTADSRWYSVADDGQREDWRDPWVFRDADRWRMLVTATAADGPEGQRGCVAAAVSPDLYTWTVEEPVVAGVGLRQLEVPQVEFVDGGWVLLFCLTGTDVVRPGLPQVTGTWSVPGSSPTGPFDFDRAEPIQIPGNYAGRIVQDRSGRWQFMGFVDVDQDGRFGGVLGNPVPLRRTERGTLQPETPAAAAAFAMR